MKNPSVSAALVLVGLALVVGGFAWLATGQTQEEPKVAVLTRPEGEAKVGFVALTPREQRKKTNMETAQRKLNHIREVGDEVQPGVFRIKDETGDPTYYLGDLVPGKGRDGEPLYLSVQLKRLPAPPLKQLTNKTHKKVKGFDKSTIKPFKPGNQDGDGSGGGSDIGTGAGQGSGGGGKSPGPK